MEVADALAARKKTNVAAMKNCHNFIGRLLYSYTAPFKDKHGLQLRMLKKTPLMPDAMPADECRMQSSLLSYPIMKAFRSCEKQRKCRKTN